MSALPPERLHELFRKLSSATNRLNDAVNDWAADQLADKQLCNELNSTIYFFKTCLATVHQPPLTTEEPKQWDDDPIP